MSELVIPDRDPDAIVGIYRYWYPELICGRQHWPRQLYLVDGELYVGGFTDDHKLFEEYQHAYQMYLAEKILLGEES